MKLHDLADKVDFENLHDICRKKLNRTYVRFDNKWYYCVLQDSPGYDDDEGHYTYYVYGEGPDWITLYGYNDYYGNSYNDVTLNDLQHVETEPVWPDAGFYYIGGNINRSFNIHYPSGQNWKAGLYESCINVFGGENQYINDFRYTLQLINHISTKDDDFPPLDTQEESCPEEELNWRQNALSVPSHLQP